MSKWRMPAGLVTGLGVAAAAASGCSDLLGIGDWSNLVADAGPSNSTPGPGGSSSGSSEPPIPSSSSSGSSVFGPVVPPTCQEGPSIPSNVPPSCEEGGEGLSNCNPADAGAESCCTSLEVPTGTYDRTYAGADSGLGSPATVSSFQLDKYLVTVGRFRAYVDYLASDAGARPCAGAGKHTYLNDGGGLTVVGQDAGQYESGWQDSWNDKIAIGANALSTWNSNLTGSGSTACMLQSSATGSFDTWTNTPGAQENLPINCVNWYEAYAFCIWDNGFLPSETEWEYVAAGGSQQREYPWGSTPPGTDNLYAIYDCYYPSGTSEQTGVGNIAPVGTAWQGAALWGQLDMAGGVWEWTLDSYSSYVDPCIDCTSASTASPDRVYRGGSFFLGQADLLPTYRNATDGPMTKRSPDLGLRCARSP